MNFMVNTPLDTPDADLMNPAARDAEGLTSLRAAIMQGNATNDAISITFAQGVTGTLMLGSALPSLTKNYTITGPGSGSLTIARDPFADAFRIFDIAGNLTCSFSGLTLAYGNSTGLGSGGAIRNLGSLTLTDCSFHDNTATHGGAIYNRGNLTASACSFWGNYATADSGGAIANENGTLTLALGCQLFWNSAAGRGGAIASWGAQGSNITIRDNTQIYANQALSGGGIHLSDGQFTMTGGALANNVARQEAGTPDSGRGGGYYGIFGTASFQGVSFTENRADNRGGGFYLRSGTLGFTTCTISGNTATAAGPGGYIELMSTYNPPVNCHIPDTVVREI